MDGMIFLEELYPEDAQSLYDLIESSRSGLLNFWWAKDATYEGTVAFLAQKSSIFSREMCYGVYVSDGEGPESYLAGVIEVRDKGDVYELGYWLGQRFRGNRIMHRAVAELIETWKKSYPSVKPFTAHIRHQNKASRSILEHAGLKEIRRDDEWTYFMSNHESFC